ncbi:hypothetical protein PRIPAC_94012, partial [Pristionchus pacificus]|uniref:Metalloendopeptidase n=1 Tax=Pristionchus pacificus TaxID=54126 RepID=A0A2A6CDB3_PRIPA
NFNVQGMKLILLLAAAAAAYPFNNYTAYFDEDSAPASPPFIGGKLPFFPGILKNRSLNIDEDAEAALNRFHKIVGSREKLAKHKSILRSLSKAKGRLLNLVRRPALKSELLSEIANRLKGTVLDRPSVSDINKPISEYLYGGDVMVSPEDLGKMEVEAHAESFRAKRGAPIVTSTRWPKTQPIAFTFNGDIDEATRKLIRTATQKIAANTCLNFKENGAGTQLQFHRGGGCWSYIGKLSQSVQPISIDRGCEIIPIISHEISHALGLDHTQNRFDRDAFVSVNFAAVDSNMQNNFAKRTNAQNNNFGVPYDYGSDMHYGAFDFSNNKQAVLVPSQGDFINTMGQRRSLTFNDYKMINALYSCSANCPAQMTCYNGGYTSPKNCNACVCTDFFTGANCQTARQLIAISETSSYKTVYHTDYNEALYTSGNDYNWDMFNKDAVKIIKAPEGKKIKVTINKLYPAFGQLPCYLSCPFFGLEFVDNSNGDLMTTMGKIYCCTKDEGVTFISKSNILGYKAYASPGMPMDATVTYTVV